MVTVRSDNEYMARAIQLARSGLYSTTPNPRVGCVVVKDGQVIGEGWHKKAGEPHAEIHALAAAGAAAQGATAYVSLEPCSHHGKTPPCAEALVKAGISRVVYAVRDPNPAVSGRGVACLEQAGIEVTGPLLEEEATALNAGFFRRMQTGRPWVFAKVAGSIDGRSAMASGESQWITGPDARADVQKLRARSCAIVTGIGTVLQDNPALTVRDESLRVDGQPLRQPLRVIIDSKLEIPLDARILDTPGRCLLACASGDEGKLAALAARNIEVVRLANAGGKVDLEALLLELGKRQCNEVMVEAGAGLLGSFLQARLVDEIILYMAPVLLGSAAQPLARLPFDTLAEKLPLDVREMRKVGSDVRWTMRPLYPQD